MNSAKKHYLRFTPQEKINIIHQIEIGISVSQVSRDHGISRTILYKWLKKYKSAGKRASEKTLFTAREKGKKHWRKLGDMKEREVVKIWRENRNLSIRKISGIAHISTGSVWKILNKYKNKAVVSGRKDLLKAKKHYNILSDSQKLTFIRRFEAGEKIAPLSREADVSRTIFYRWIKKYKENGKNETAVIRHYPRSEEHWRFMPGVEAVALQVVSKNPHYSLAKIREEIIKDGKNISRSGLFYMLKRFDMQAAPRESFEISGFLIFSFMFLFSLLIFGFSYTDNSVHKAGRDSRFGFGYVITDDGWEKYSPVRQVLQQDLSWGAFAANTVKSLYTRDEKVEMGFGVVDSRGQTVCDAEIEMEIGNINRMIASFSATENSIKKSGECGLQTVTNTADYLANKPGGLEKGVYSINIDINNGEYKREFNDRIIVVDEVPFEVSRTSYPTRIYPNGTYPVEIHIKANTDFIGEVSDTIPDGVRVSKVSGGIVFKNIKENVDIIKWDMNIKKGESYTLRYNLRFADVYPAFYEIGPMEFVEQSTGSLVFREARYWQIAADSL